jgi:hypothetical protein
MDTATLHVIQMRGRIAFDDLFVISCIDHRLGDVAVLPQFGFPPLPVGTVSPPPPVESSPARYRIL